MTPFTWTDCSADVHAVFHSRTVAAFARSVIAPTLAVLNNEIDTLTRSTEGTAPFAKADMEALSAETHKAFALALQSLWERQLRDYVRSCVTALKLDEAIAKNALSNNWNDVERAFRAARGLALKCFPSYPALKVLHFIGNICRHGEGPSVAKLHACRPDLWPELSYGLVDLRLSPHVPTAPTLRVTPALLDEFTAAIGSFWYDIETIYLQSLQLKHTDVGAELESRRTRGAWMPTMEEIADGL